MKAYIAADSQRCRGSVRRRITILRQKPNAYLGNNNEEAMLQLRAERSHCRYRRHQGFGM